VKRTSRLPIADCPLELGIRQTQEMTMRFFGLSALAVIAFSTTMMSKNPEATP